MSADIFSLPNRRLSLTQPVMQQVEGYWDGLRNGRAAPSRAEIDPRGLAGALPHCFILERIAPGLGRFRVCGQQVSGIFGRDMRGMPFGLLFTPEARETLEPLLERVFQGPTIVDCQVEVSRGSHQGEMRLLPVRDDLGAVTRVLGCLSLDDASGPKPMRLTIPRFAERVVAQTPIRDLYGLNENGPRPKAEPIAQIIPFEPLDR